MIFGEVDIVNLATPGGFIVTLVFIIKWFMKQQERSNVVIDNNTKALQAMCDESRELKHAVRNAPCGKLFKEHAEAELAARQARDRLEQE